MSNLTDTWGNSTDTSEDGSQPAYVANWGTLSAYLLSNVFDLYGLVVLYFMLKAQKTSPILKARRPWLISVSVFYNFIYNLIQTIDGIQFEYSLTGGICCGYWESADGIYYSVFIEIVLLRVLIVTALIHFASHAEGVIAVAFNKDTSMLQEVKDKEESEPVNEHVRNINRLNLMKRLSGWKFGAAFIMVAFVFHLIPFIVTWVKDPDIVRLSYADYTLDFECYVSMAYEFSAYWVIVIGVIASVLCWYLNRKYSDPYHLTHELIVLAMFWVVYNAWGQGSIAIENLDYTLSQFIWSFWNFVYYFMFVHWPVIKEHARKKGKTLRFAQIFDHARSFFSPEQVSHHVSSMELINQNDAIKIPHYQKHPLYTILKDEQCFETFKKFCESEFCVENILFWQQVEKYKVGCYQAATIESDNEKLWQMNILRQNKLGIVNIFLRPRTTLEINIEFSLRDQLILDAERHSEIEDPSFFDAAQFEIFNLMKLGPFARFKLTDEYAKLTKELILRNNGRDKGVTEISRPSGSAASVVPGDFVTSPIFPSSTSV